MQGAAAQQDENSTTGPIILGFRKSHLASRAAEDVAECNLLKEDKKEEFEVSPAKFSSFFYILLNGELASLRRLAVFLLIVWIPILLTGVAQNRRAQRRSPHVFYYKQPSAKPPERTPWSAPPPAPVFVQVLFFLIHVDWLRGTLPILLLRADDWPVRCLAGERYGSHEMWCVLAALRCTVMTIMMVMFTEAVLRQVTADTNHVMQ